MYRTFGPCSKSKEMVYVSVVRRNSRTTEMSDNWDVGQVGKRTCPTSHLSENMSDNWVVGQVRCRTTGLSDK